MKKFGLRCSITIKFGITEYRNGAGQRHRLDGPAYIDTHMGGWQSWWINGIRHREDGPAVIKPDGVEYWLDYNLYQTKEAFDIEIARRKANQQ